MKEYVLIRLKLIQEMNYLWGNKSTQNCKGQENDGLYAIVGELLYKRNEFERQATNHPIND